MDVVIPKLQKLNKTEWAHARKRAISTLDAICAICNKPIDLDAPKNTPLAVEVDHIVPKSRGGALYALENLQLTHHTCNRKKGSKMPEDYADLKSVNPIPLSNNW